MTHSRYWHVKELSELTKISVRTLHHYDAINLLKPSHRRINGYRLYSESDIMRLQQILALKSLGFKLSVISKIMDKKMPPLEHFQAQKEMLNEKITSLMAVRQIIDDILIQGDFQSPVSLEKVINLIEEYQMSKELENSWQAKVFSKDELKQLAEFEVGLKTKYSPAEKEAFENNWATLVKEIEQHISTDPDSNLGRDIGKRCMDLVNPLFRPDQHELKKAIWDKGYRAGAVPLDQGGVKPEVAQWLDRAISSYHLHRAYGILNKIENQSPSQDIIDAWLSLVTELSGSSEAVRQEVYSAALADENIREEAKKWLKKQI